MEEAARETKDGRVAGEAPAGAAALSSRPFSGPEAQGKAGIPPSPPPEQGCEPPTNPPQQPGSLVKTGVWTRPGCEPFLDLAAKYLQYWLHPELCGPPQQVSSVLLGVKSLTSTPPFLPPLQARAGPCGPHSIAAAAAATTAPASPGQPQTFVLNVFQCGWHEPPPPQHPKAVDGGSLPEDDHYCALADVDQPETPGLPAPPQLEGATRARFQTGLRSRKLSWRGAKKGFRSRACLVMSVTAAVVVIAAIVSAVVAYRFATETSDGQKFLQAAEVEMRVHDTFLPEMSNLTSSEFRDYSSSVCTNMNSSLSDRMDLRNCTVVSLRNGSIISTFQLEFWSYQETAEHLRSLLLSAGQNGGDPVHVLFGSLTVYKASIHVRAVVACATRARRGGCLATPTPLSLDEKTESGSLTMTTLATTTAMAKTEATWPPTSSALAPKATSATTTAATSATTAANSPSLSPSSAEKSSTTRGVTTEAPTSTTKEAPSLPSTTSEPSPATSLKPATQTDAATLGGRSSPVLVLTITSQKGTTVAASRSAEFHLSSIPAATVTVSPAEATRQEQVPLTTEATKSLSVVTSSLPQTASTSISSARQLYSGSGTLSSAATTTTEPGVTRPTFTNAIPSNASFMCHNTSENLAHPSNYLFSCPAGAENLFVPDSDTYPNHCGHFIRCVNGYAFPFTCGEGTHFRCFNNGLNGICTKVDDPESYCNRRKIEPLQQGDRVLD